MLPHTRKLAFVAMLAATAFGSATAASAASGQEELQRLLNTHLFRGGVITPDVKAATGDPNIPVVDWRIFGDYSSCSYRYVGGYFEGRILHCE